MVILSNIYLIENLDDLKCKYRLFRIRGMDSSSDYYESDVGALVRKLSGITRSPCAPVRRNDKLYVAQAAVGKQPPAELVVGGRNVLIESTEIAGEMRFGSLSKEDRSLASRFLRFFLERNPVYDPRLWRPGAGGPFFEKRPDGRSNGHSVSVYRGFKFRPIHIPDGRIGICVDLSTTYIASSTIPQRVSPKEFIQYKGRRCLYEFGHNWYEIRISGMSDLNVGEVRLPGGQFLFDYLHSRTNENKPASIQRLSRSCSVLTYENFAGEIRSVPSALCRLVYDTGHAAVGRQHGNSVISPSVRKQRIDDFVNKYLRSLRFGSTPIVLARSMLETETLKLAPPDLLFGRGKILSVNGTSGCTNAPFEKLGPAKLQMLGSSEAGFFSKKLLDRQYIILPESVLSRFGHAYVADLKEQFNNMYRVDGQAGYDPGIVSYDDAQDSSYQIGREITGSVKRSCPEQGYALVVIPRRDTRNSIKEEELANYVTRSLRSLGIFSSVAHSDTPAGYYTKTTDAKGRTTYGRPASQDKQRRFKSYLFNLVLNKILLLNSCWPFVLARPTNADMTVGIDIKNDAAGFTAVLKDGRTLFFRSSHSAQKEKISRARLSKRLYEILKEELGGGKTRISRVTIHRDGTAFRGEIQGANDALLRLADENIIDDNFDCNVIEVRKSSSIPLRFFELRGNSNKAVENPAIGTCGIFDDVAYVCNTGRPFRRRGTTNPVQIAKVAGNMPFKDLLEDQFHLSCLTWTKVDDCSRDPITIKMTDIKLRGIAGRYDRDSFEFAEGYQDE